MGQGNAFTRVCDSLHKTVWCTGVCGVEGCLLGGLSEGVCRVCLEGVCWRVSAWGCLPGGCALECILVRTNGRKLLKL